MSHADPAKKLVPLLKRLIAAAGPVEPLTLEPFAEASPLECDLLFSYLLWDSNSTLARAAYQRLTEAFVDMNHLRVAMPEEIAAILGERYPRSEHRSARLRATLHDIFKREHTLALTRLTAAGKREARHYLDSLEGMHGFVAARLLNRLGTHAIPLDDRLRVMLTEEHALDPVLSLAEAQHWLEHQIPAENAAIAAHALQCWLDTHPLHRGKDEDPEVKPKTRAAKPKAAKPARAPKSKGQPKT